VLTTYRKIRKGKIVSDDEQSLIKSHLKLSGVVKNEGGVLRLRNQIYKKVFDDKWVVESMPDAERRRERAAFRRGVLLASMVGALVLSLVSGLAVYALQKRNEALRQTATAEQQRARAIKQTEIANNERARAVAATNEEKAQRNVAEERQREAVAAQKTARKAAENERIQRSKAEVNAQQALMEKTRAEAQTARANQESVAARQAYEEYRQSVKSYRQSLYAAYMGLTQQAYNSGNIARGSEFFNADLFHDETLDPRRFEWYYLWHLYNSDIFTFAYADDELTAVVFSPDGHTLAASSADNDIYLLDPVSHLERRRLSGHSGPVVAIAYSSDGKTLASATTEGGVKLWDVATGTESAKLEVAKNIRAIALSSDGKLVTVTDDGNAILSDVVSGKALDTLVPYLEDNPFTAFLDAAFSPNGKLLATGDDNGKVTLFDIASSTKTIASFSAHVTRVNAVAFSPDGKILATASDDRSVKLWDVTSCEKSSCKEIAQLVGHTEPVVALAFSPDGKTLASGSRDSSAKIWSVMSHNELRTIRGHTGTINSVAYSPDGNTLATASADEEIKLWDLRAGSDELATDTVAAVSQNQKLAAMMKDGDLVLWDLEHQQRIASAKGLGLVFDLAFSPDGKTIAASANQGVELFCITSAPGQTPTEALHSCHKFETNDLFTATMAFSPDSSLLVTHAGFDDTNIKIWDVASEKLRTIVQTYAVSSLAVSSDNKVLAVGTYGAGVKLFNIETQKEIVSPFINTGNVYAVAFSPDGNILASGNTVGGVQLRYMERDPITSEIATSRLLSLRGYNEQVTSISFSPDGNTLITGSIEGKVKLWDLASRLDMLTLEDHMTAIKSAYILADGRTLVTASSEKIRIWRGATDQELKEKGQALLPNRLKDDRGTVARTTNPNWDPRGSSRFWGNGAANRGRSTLLLLNLTQKVICTR
jgi:WD40 repeat protein